MREQLGVDIPEGEYVTLGGFLFDAFGHIPEEGERLDHDGWELRVAEMDKRRVAKVVVQALRGRAAEQPTADGPDEPSTGLRHARPAPGFALPSSTLPGG